MPPSTLTYPYLCYLSTPGHHRRESSRSTHSDYTASRSSRDSDRRTSSSINDYDRERPTYQHRDVIEFSQTRSYHDSSSSGHRTTTTSIILPPGSSGSNQTTTIERRTPHVEGIITITNNNRPQGARRDEVHRGTSVHVRPLPPPPPPVPQAPGNGSKKKKKEREEKKLYVMRKVSCPYCRWSSAADVGSSLRTS